MDFTQQQTGSHSTIQKLYFTALRYQKLGAWFIMLAAYGYLAVQLFNFKHYPELLSQWKQTSFSQFGWLAAVLILLPLNWSLEAMKWQKLTANQEVISFRIALKAVFAGVYTGFFTPNRVSEMLGRALFLKSENRKAGAVLSVVNSVTQNIIMTLCGIPAGLFFFSMTKNANAETSHFFIGLAFCLILFILLLFYLPLISRYITSHHWLSKISSYTSSLSAISRPDLFRILFLSLLRYLVFCVQFFLMLRFFGVMLEPLHALIAIPANYLFVTYTPSIAFSEAAVRSAYAVLFIGAFSTQLVGIALAGVCIWVVNFGIPLLIGSIVMVRIRLDNN